MQKIFYITSFFLLFELFSPANVQGAEISIQTDTMMFAPSQTFEVVISIKPEKEIINAIQADITYPSDLLEIKQIKNGDSIIPLWVAEPAATTEGTIHFAGIIPGGFDTALNTPQENQQGKLFTVIFSAKKEGTGTIQANNPQVLLNDGEGTQTQTSTPTFSFEIKEGSAPVGMTPRSIDTDTNPPEPFTLQITSDQNMFDGAYFLVFAATDKDTGIDYYEVKEEPQSFSVNRIFHKSEWEKAKIPYLLSDQTLQSNVHVRAVDKSGNQRTTTLSAKKTIPWYTNLLWLSSIFIGTLIVSSVIGKTVIWKRRRNLSLE